MGGTLVGIWSSCSALLSFFLHISLNLHIINIENRAYRRRLATV